jgi:hypothetical protein
VAALNLSRFIIKGWKILMEKSGLQIATQFVIWLERGIGDTVQEINDYWGDASIDEIHNQMMAWKARQQ